MNRSVVLAVALLAAVSARSAEKPFALVAFGDSTAAPRGGLTVYATMVREQLEAKGRPLNGGNTTAMACACHVKLAEQTILALQQQPTSEEQRRNENNP